jgi:hypothetical protein
MPKCPKTISQEYLSILLINSFSVSVVSQGTSNPGIPSTVVILSIT